MSHLAQKGQEVTQIIYGQRSRDTSSGHQAGQQREGTAGPWQSSGGILPCAQPWRLLCSTFGTVIVGPVWPGGAWQNTWYGNDGVPKNRNLMVVRAQTQQLHGLGGSTHLSTWGVDRLTICRVIWGQGFNP